MPVAVAGLSQRERSHIVVDDDRYAEAVLQDVRHGNVFPAEIDAEPEDTLQGVDRPGDADPDSYAPSRVVALQDLGYLGSGALEH